MTNKMTLRKLFLDSFAGRRLLHEIHENLTAVRDERDDVANEIVALHNEGLIDAVAAFEDLKNDSSGPDFFLTRHVFEKALPTLEAPVERVMRCVLKLCREAGQDMAAGMLFSSYIQFCEKDPARSREALTIIETDPNNLSDMLPATVAAGSKLDNSYYFLEILRLIHHPTLAIRRTAIFSITQLHWQKGESVPDIAISTLSEITTKETHDQILANIIRAAFAIYKQDTNCEAHITALITTALDKGNVFTLHAASEMLWTNSQEITPPLLNILLTRLKNINPDNKGTLDVLDYGIAGLLEQEHAEQGLCFLEFLLINYSEKIDIKVFNSTASKIRSNKALMSRLFTRWLLNGKLELCEAVHEIISPHYGATPNIEIDAQEIIPKNYINILFIARKAIGYFFLEPVIAANTLVSLMHHAPDNETIDELAELLFNPLLINYPGRIRDTVQEKAKSENGEIKEAIERALTSLENYLSTLQAIPKLPALQPSQSQREAYRRHMSDSLTESMKLAEKNSIFLNLVSRSTILYGNKAIDYYYSHDGEPRRTETSLTSHGISMDFPRMENIDSYGLNYMIKVFRLEQLTK